MSKRKKSNVIRNNKIGSALQSRFLNASHGAFMTLEFESSLTVLLHQLAVSDASSVVVYQQVLEHYAFHGLPLPNGADLIDIIKNYNKHESKNGRRLSVGSAGTSREALAEFNQRLVQNFRERVDVDGMPAHVLRSVGAAFDSVVVTVREQVSISFNEQLVRSQAAHEEANTQQANAFAIERAGHVARQEQLEKEMAELQSVNEQLAAAVDRLELKCADHVSSLDSMARKYQDRSVGEAAAKAGAASLANQLRARESELAQAVLNERTERHERMLVSDKNKQLEISLARLQESNVYLKSSLNLQKIEIESLHKKSAQWDSQVGDLVLQIKTTLNQSPIPVQKKSRTTKRKPATSAVVRADK